MTKYVVGFMFNEDKTQVALIRKTKPEWQNGLHNGIGGKIEKGESSIEAMRREFHEETGVLTRLSDWELLVRGYDLAKTYTVDFYYGFFPQEVLDNLSSPTEENVVIVNHSWELDAIPVIPNLHWLIRMCLDKSIEIAHVIFK